MSTLKPSTGGYGLRGSQPLSWEEFGGSQGRILFGSGDNFFKIKFENF
jgi:hypothetical protein